MRDKLVEIMGQYVDLDGKEITDHTRFIEDLGFNSYDFMSMLGEIEEEFDIEIDEKEVIKLHTVKEAVDYFEALTEEN